MLATVLFLFTSQLSLSSCLAIPEGTQRPYTAEITPEAGSSWGNWGNSEFCPSGSWAAGFQLKVEDSCGLMCDDTALNGVKLLCVDSSGFATGEATSFIGGYGHWKNHLKCQPHGGYNVSYIHDVQFRSEHETRIDANSRHVDETAGNNLNGACLGGDTLVGDGESFGIWSHYVRCPTNSAICGLKTQVESSQGMSDDTALNQITFYCCSL